ncbi:MAG: protein-L-isoaspartate O-methyltransferase family protein [bacterium]
MKRRFYLQVFLFLLLLIPFGFECAAGEGWNYSVFIKAMKESGRDVSISTSDFDNIQKRKERALAEIKRYLTEKFGNADPLVLKAFREVPREYFQYNYQYKKFFGDNAYEVPAQHWSIGYGSVLSDYLGQAYMTQLSQPKPDDVVLEIGTGSGYQIAIFSRICKEVYSIEIIKPLGDAVSKIFKPLGYSNVHTKVGDGYYGWADVKGGFDIIIVTCAAPYVSPELLKQLKPDGRLIVPIGQPFKKGQFLYVYTKDKNGKVHSRRDMGVYFIPMRGAIEGK